MKKIILFFTTVVLSLSLIYSCIDDNYDISNLDTTLELGGDLIYIPIGETDSLFIKDFMDESALKIFQQNEKGEYSFIQKDTLDFSDQVPDMSKLKFDAQVFEQSYVSKAPNLNTGFVVEPINYTSDVALSVPSVDFSDVIPEVSFSKTFAINPTSSSSTTTRAYVQHVELPYDGEVEFIVPQINLASDEISGINTVLLKDPSYIKVDFSKKNMASVSASLKNFKITFPEEFEVEGTDNTNSVTVPSAEITEEGFIHEYKIISIDLSNYKVQSGVISPSFKLSYDMIIAADIPLVNPANYEVKMDISSLMTVDDIEVDINDITVDLDGMINEKLNIKLEGFKEDYGSMKVYPKDNPSLDIDLMFPNVNNASFRTTDDGMTVVLPNFFKFKNVPQNYNYNADNSTLTIKGEIPDKISLDFDYILVDPVKENDSYYMKGDISVSGGIVFVGNEYQYSEIDKFNSQKISISTSIPRLEPYLIEMLEFKYSVSEEIDFNMDVNQGLDKILRVDKIILEPTPININIDLKDMNIDFGDNPLKLKMELSFPEKIGFDDERIINKNGKNVFTDEFVYKLGDKIKIEDLMLDNFTLNQDIVNNKLSIAEKIGVNIELSVENPQIDISTLSDIEVSAKITIPETKPKIFIGKVDLSIDPVSQKIKIEGLPKDLNTEDMVFDLANPVLKLNIETNVSVPIKGSLTIIPYAKGLPVPGAAIENLIITLPAAEMKEEPTKTKFWISNSDEPHSGYTLVKADLAKLIKKFPDEIEIKFEPIVDINATQTVALYDNYVIKMDYILDAPLEFGEDFFIPISAEIKNIDKQMSDIIVNLFNSGLDVTLYASTYNNSPLEFNLGLDTYDSEGKATPLKATPQTIMSCDENGDAVKTDLEIKLNSDGGKITDISLIKLNFNAKSGGDLVSGIGISDETFLKLDLALKITGGITIDIQDYLNSKDKK